MNEKVRVGFIGLGMMGKPLSTRVLEAGYPLTVYDIRPEPVEQLVSKGARKAETPKEVAEASDVVLTCLPTLKSCEEVYLGANGLLKGTRAGEILIETSTVPPSLVRKFADEAKKQGVVVIDAAMQGRTLHHPGLSDLRADEVAARGLVTLLVGGQPDEVEKVRPVLATFGNPIFHLGPVGSGQMVKVLTNGVGHVFYVAVCEMLALAAKAGVDLRKLQLHWTKTAPRGWVVESGIIHYLETGTGKMGHMDVTKDVESILEVGKEYGVPLLMQGITLAYYQWADSTQARSSKDMRWDEALFKMWEDIIGGPIRFK